MSIFDETPSGLTPDQLVLFQQIQRTAGGIANLVPMESNIAILPNLQRIDATLIPRVAKFNAQVGRFSDTEAMNSAASRIIGKFGQFIVDRLNSIEALNRGANNSFTNGVGLFGVRVNSAFQPGVTLNERRELGSAIDLDTFDRVDRLFVDIPILDIVLARSIFAANIARAPGPLGAFTGGAGPLSILRDASRSVILLIRRMCHFRQTISEVRFLLMIMGQPLAWDQQPGNFNQSTVMFLVPAQGRLSVSSESPGLETIRRG